MRTRGEGDTEGRALSSRGGSRWRQWAFLGIVGVGIVVFFAAREEVRPPADRPDAAWAQEVRVAAAPSQQARVAAPPWSGAWATSAGGPVLSDIASGQRAAAAPASVVQARYPVLEDLVAPLRNAQELTPEAAKDLKRRLHALRERGADVVPAIRDFLRSGQDVDFDKMRGGRLAEQRTLRLALIDTLRQMGGAEAIEVSLEQLRMTESPGEIAMLALNLEEAMPGVYRDEAMWTVIGALQASARTKDPLEVRPLFGALQLLGGAEAMAALNQLPHNADTVGYLRNKDTHVSPTVGTFALITLASLPGGEGVFSLAELAGDPNVPVAHRTVGPFQMLAQASAANPLAGEELVALALDGQVPDRAWDAVANALAGKHLQFPSLVETGTLPGTNLTSGSGSTTFVRGFYDDERNVLYEERLVSRNWSATQVQQQLVLIDMLLEVTNAPAATQALKRARETLQRRRP